MDFNDIDLQWFADDDDDTTTESQNTEEHGVPDNIADDFDFSEEAGFTQEEAARAAQSDNEEGDTSSWDEYNTNFGYDVDEDGDTKINLHNASKAVDDAKHAVKGWMETTGDKVNQFFGGARGGYTNADRERAEEAAAARKTYEDKAAEKQAAIDNLKASKSYDPEKDKDTVAQLEKERDDLQSRANAINRDIQSTDTGSRIGNMVGNAKEDLGDVGTSINQFFGGADQYGLGKEGKINDRNGDGKVSLSERARNIGRDVAEWGREKLQNLATSAILTSLGPMGWIAQPFVNQGINWAGQHLADYAKSHPLTANEKEAIAQQEKENQTSSSEDNPVQEARPSDALAQASSSTRFGGWDTKALSNMAETGRTYGWNKTNDVMGHSTQALSDAHFKDFVLATMVDSPAVQNVIKTKLMLEYFK